MKKSKQAPNAQELRDQPVPPVKGAVTDPEDAILRPHGNLGMDRSAQLEDSAVFGSWL